MDDLLWCTEEEFAGWKPGDLFFKKSTDTVFAVAGFIRRAPFLKENYVLLIGTFVSHQYQLGMEAIEELTS